MKPDYEEKGIVIYNGDSLSMLKGMDDETVQTCVTSPPYWGLRDYGVEGQLGLEKTPEEYVEKMVEIFREVRRVLKKDGTLWLNLGDSYNGSGGAGGDYNKGGLKEGQPKYSGRNVGTLKPKDLVGIPWRVAFALQSDGWYLRSDIIWCLSGGTWLYTRTQKGDMPMMLKDMSRLDPKTVQLWNGEKWTQLLGTSKTPRAGNEIELVLRSGERISCTVTHKFPTNRGLLEASEIKIGDCLESVLVPEPENPKNPKNITLDAAWFAGLYIAEGSRSNKCIQIAGHAKEEARWKRLCLIVRDYGGHITRTIDGNKMDIRIYGKVLASLLDEFVSGRIAKDKCLSPVCWKYSNKFLMEILNGYLSGDGGWDKLNKRWRIGFTRNYNLERDLRALAARLGFNLTLKLSNSFMGDRKFPSFRGEIRFESESKKHWNQKNKTEVVEIKKARARFFYDVGVEDKPHLFALSSGTLTHNSKPNPMPESVTDRPTKSHEYIFLMSKSQKYYYDADAIKEPTITNDTSLRNRDITKLNNTPGRTRMGGLVRNNYDTRNKRSVWTVTTKPYKEAHFATFPPDLIVPCIKAGSRKGDVVLDPFGGSMTTAYVAKELNRKSVMIELNEKYINIGAKRLSQGVLEL